MRKLLLILTAFVLVTSCKKEEHKIIEENILNNEKIEEPTNIILPEYSIIESEDISIKTSLNDNAETNKRLTYSVLVPENIKREQIEPLFNKLIDEIKLNDMDIDDVTIWLFSSKDIAKGNYGYDIAMATWLPADGEVTDDIAITNNRDSYKLNISIADKLEEYLKSKSENTIKFGLSEQQRKNISYEIDDADNRASAEANKIYSKLNNNYEEYGDKLDYLNHKYYNLIIKRHKINEEILNYIIGEGIEKKWARPQ